MPTLTRQLYMDSTGTSIRLWAQFVEDTLFAGGWQVTGDGGQKPPSLLPPPVGTAANQMLGYRIYKMTDNISNVYLRIDYGTGTEFQFSPPPHSPAFWLTVGTGSDGNGNITEVMLPSLQSWQTTANQSTITNCYGSADQGRCAISLFNGALGFSIERSKSVAGVDTADGLLFNSSKLYGDSNGPHVGLGNSAFLSRSKLLFPVIDNGMHYYHTTVNPAPIINGNKSVGVPFYFFRDAQQPGINWVIVNQNDIGADSQIMVNIYGVWHLYQTVGIIPLVGVIAAQPFAQTAIVLDSQRKLLMRWE